jgi:hypothetical protein
MRELYACDLVHCYRCTDRMADVRRLRERGVAVTVDNDDNHAAALVSEGGKGLAGRRFNRRVFKEMLQLAALSNLATTPSPALADIYRAEGVQDVAVIDNHLERSMVGFGLRAKHDGVVIGWVAAWEHEVDRDRLPLVAAIERALELHDDARMLTVGLRLPLRSPRYEHLDDVPFPHLLKVLAGVDVGIAPLADIAFNRTRSSVKLKEYASAGAAWLASPVGPYRGLGEREGGLLVDEHDWTAALDVLLRDGRRRNRLSKRALRWAKAEAIDNHAQEWEHAFQLAVSRAQPAARG